MSGAFLAVWAVLLAPSALQAAKDTREAAAKVRSGQNGAKAEITFLGYQGLPGGGGSVFVDLSRRVTVEVSRSGQRIEYKLVGASVPLKNNRHPLLLRDFGSSALSAVLVPGKGSVRLVIDLRGEASSPSYKMVERPGAAGAALVVVLPPRAN